MARDLFGNEVKLPAPDSPALTTKQRRKLFRKPTQQRDRVCMPGIDRLQPHLQRKLEFHLVPGPPLPPYGGKLP